MFVSRSARDVAVTLAALLAAACGAPDGAVAPTPAAPATAPAAALAAASLEVRPGESIQAAVDAAAPGATIRIRPGLYREAVIVNKRDITITGMPGPHGERVIIENPGTAAHGIRVNDGDGFTLTDVTVRNFVRNGVVLFDSDDFKLARIVAEDNGAYGLYPIRSSHGVVEHCTTSGSADAGIYVGLSNDVRVRHNVVFANVAGIEVSNADDVEVFSNDIYDNTIGILVTLVPGRPVLTSYDVSVSHNRVVNNNLPNFAPAGDLVSYVPRGIGILILGPDRVTVEKNTVTGNDFFGIGVIDEAVLAMFGLERDLAGIETASNHVEVRQNTATGNGSAPPPELGGAFPGVDLLWDGTGTGNCWEKNTFGTSFPSPLPACK